MSILNNEESTYQNASGGCRAHSSTEYPGTGRVSDIHYEFVEEGQSNLYIAGREAEGPVRLTSFHRNCHQCPYNILVRGS